MLNILLNRHDPTTIGNVEIEVTLSENHQYRNDVTSYPVEDGFDITDHIHQQPEKITISGVFSDTPLPIRNGSLKDFIKGAGENRTQKAMEQLLIIAGYAIPKQEKNKGLSQRGLDKDTTLSSSDRNIKPQIVDIVSGLRVYTNMICTSVTLPRETRTGYSLQFSMSFRKIKTVESKIVTIDKTSDLNGKAPRISDQAPKTKETGVQTTKAPKTVFLQLYEATANKYRGN